MTPMQNLRKACAINLNTSSFSARIPTTVKPSGNGTVPIQNGEETLEVLPYGLGANNDAFDFRVTGWKQYGIGSLWFPEIIAEVSGVMSSSVPGIVFSDVLSTEYFCDTLTLNKGIGIVTTVTADHGLTKLIVDVSGFAFWDFTSDQITNTPTNNALYCMY